MGISKWLGATLGMSFGGPIGAILGFALGSMVDGFSSGSIKVNTGSPYGGAQTRTRTKSSEFDVSLLILAAIVIKADGVSDKRELDFVRAQFVGMYGKERANEAFKLFKNISQQKDIPVRDVCLQIKQMMDHPSRLQLLHFLFGIAKADGNVSEVEVNAIYTISNYLGIRAIDFESIKAMFYNSSDNAYKILEIEKSATPEEIKKAYRKMAKKYHPDKVLHLGEEYQKGAEEKFRQVQEAYDQLQKARDFK